MSQLDYIIIGVIVISSLFGLSRGLVREAGSLLVWIGGFVAGLVFGPTVAIDYGEYLGGGAISEISAFILVLILVLLIGKSVQAALGFMVESTGLSATDRILGFGFGGLRGALLVTVMLMLLQAFVSASLFWEESQLKYAFLEFEDEILSGVGRFGDEIDQLKDAGDGLEYSDAPIPEEPPIYID
jgi:membrane protein required for colicin V production